MKQKKIILVSFRVIFLKHFLIFLKLRAAVIRSVQRNGVIFDVYILLYDLEVLKSFSFEGCFHLGNKKIRLAQNQVSKMVCG